MNANGFSRIKSAVIYARFSPRPDADETESLSWQFEFCRDWLRDHGIKLNKNVFGEINDEPLPRGCFADPDVSGGEIDRPGLWMAMHMLKRGSALVAYKLDRVARSVYVSAIVEREITKAGARLISASGEGTWSDNDPQDQMVRQILNAVDECARKVGNARTSAAMQLYQRQGRMMGGKCPYGWREIEPEILPNGRKQKRMREDPIEQENLRRIVELRDSGRSYSECEAALRRESRRNRSGNWFGSQQIRTIYLRVKREKGEKKR